MPNSFDAEIGNDAIKEIVYIAFVSANHVGVVKKIERQCASWLKSDANVKNVKIVYDCSREYSLFRIVYRYWVLLKYFIISRNRSNVVVYLRQTQCLPLMGFMSRFAYFVYEVNADSKFENNSLQMIKRILRIFLTDNFIKNAKIVFYVSRELQDRMHTGSGKSYVFPNSLRTLPIKKELPRSYNVVFVGTDEYAWQGTDILFEMAKLMPEYIFNLVGHFNRHYNLANIIYHGVLTGSAYDGLMRNMDYGVGTLAFYRSGLTEGSTLKVRDYIAYNLPIIAGYIDSDFKDTSFYLKLSVCGLFVDIDEVRTFLNSWRNNSLEGLVPSSICFEQREMDRCKIMLDNEWKINQCVSQDL
jgi:hypothetical protein